MIELLTSGILTTVQDLGRQHVGELGVPVSGAMDAYSAQLANRLLANDVNDAVIEMNLTAANLTFHQDSLIAVTGANMSAKLNNKAIKLNARIRVMAGDELSFGRLQFGARCYVGVKGGIQTELVLGSRSQFQSITTAAVYKQRDCLPINTLRTDGKSNSSIFEVQINHDFFTQTMLTVKPGPEFDQLTQPQQEQLLSCEFTVSARNNRMAYQLEETIKNTLPAILTSAVLPGTVQLTPAGHLLILMRDCQTTGGYPRILQLTQHAINQLAQKKNGDLVEFYLG